MPFLENYTTLDAFFARYPGLKQYKETLAIYFEAGDYSGALRIVLKEYPELVQYPPEDLYHGLCALSGKAKGKNTGAVVRPSVVLKYDSYSYRAEEKVNEVAPRIEACVNLARKIASKLYHRVNDPHESVDAILKYHFGFERKIEQTVSLVQLKDSVALDRVIGGFQAIHKGILGRICIADNELDRFRDRKVVASGYVVPKLKEKYTGKLISPYKTFGTWPIEGKDEEVVWGSIHVDFGLFTGRPNPNSPKPKSDLELARLIIHEASHKFLFTDDHAYCHEEEKYIGLSNDLKLKNADSYAYAAISLYRGKLITHKDTELLTTETS